jgi:hypothetical protein
VLLLKREMYIYLMSHEYKFHDQDKLYECIHLNPVTAGFIKRPKIGSIVAQKIFVNQVIVSKGRLN